MNKTYKVTLCDKKGYYYSYLQFAVSSKEAKEKAMLKITKLEREDKIISARVMN